MSSDITILPPSSLPDQFTPPTDISGAADDAALIAMWLSEQRSRHTVRLYDRVAFGLTQTLPHGLRGATVADIMRFEKGIASLKPKSKHTIMSAVRSLFSFASRTGYINKSPAHVRKNRAPPYNSRHRYLTEDEVWTIVDHATNDRDRVLLRFLYGTAVRVSELCSIVWADVHPHGKGYAVQILGKGGIYRTVQIPDWVGLVRPDNARSDDAVFTVSGPDSPHPWPPMSDSNIRWIMREATLAAGLAKKVSPHWFRHAAITNAENNGESVVNLRDWAGHTNINTTSKYLHGKAHSAPGDALGRKPKTDK